MYIINPFALFCAACVTSYWTTVVIKVIRMKSKIGKSPNVIPKESLGYLSRAIMLPLVILWLLLPWKAAFSSTLMSSKLAWLGAIFCFVSYGFSLYCWHCMGQSWRIGIDPKEKNQLITSGPFQYIRHPIYAFSMLLMLGSLFCVQTKSMLGLCGIHFLIFTLEAIREERYLCKIYGETYQNYMNQTNRFLPKV